MGFSVQPPRRPAPWEWALALLAAALAAGLGMARLDVPSLWHDELVHVAVAERLAEGHGFTLPSGAFYPSSMAWHAVLAVPVALFGDGEAAVRAPSVAFFTLTVLLTFLLARRLLGREAALAAAFTLALSPWSVAWAREARMYSMQAALYAAFLLLLWESFEAPSPRRAAGFWAGAAAAYLLGVLASFHGILFLAGPGLYAGLRWLAARQWRSRWTLAVALLGALGLLTLLALRLNPNPADQSAVFQTGLGGTLVDPQRLDRYDYFRWLKLNLSTGVLLTVLLGSVLVWRRGWRGAFTFLAFWAPLLVLTFLIGYRRPRFMFFAFPVYTMLFAWGLLRLYDGVLLLRRIRGFRRARTWAAAALAIGCILFLGRLGVSLARLTGDTLDVARGAHTTLARRHPQWRAPCAWVHDRLNDETVLATTWLPVRYYLGRVDNWFPNRYSAWEVQESGLPGLASLEELRAFLAQHPRGYFIAEYARFEMWRGHGDLRDTLGREVDWVRLHMERVDEACSEDVTVYRWDFTGRPVPPAE